MYTEMQTPDKISQFDLQIDYRDLSATSRFMFDFKVASVRFVYKAIFTFAGLFQKLESKRRIYEKSYPRHPHLKHRFIPPLEPLNQPPLFLDIHGGGWVMGDPSNDDEPNLCISTTLNCFVISMVYTKAPTAQFPIPVNQLTETVLDILADTSLSFDRSRVVIGGYSAGGNFSLAVAQSPLLKDKLRGVVSWYPPTDTSISRDEKITSRPYQRADEVDALKGNYNTFVRAYIPRELMHDPRVCVTKTRRESLPRDLLFIGAENDMLCKEAAVMAGRYAGMDLESSWERDVNEKFGFEAEGIKWICERNAEHGFTHTIFNFGTEGKRRTEVARRHYVEICRWLSDGPFSLQNRECDALQSHSNCAAL